MGKMSKRSGGRWHPLYKLGVGKYEKYTCVYCEALADTMDHVPPLAIVEALEGCEDAYRDVIRNSDMVVVPACRDCNGKLGSHMRMTVAESKALLDKWKDKEKT